MKKPTRDQFHLMLALDGLVMALRQLRKGTKKHEAVCMAIFLLKPYVKRSRTVIPDALTEMASGRR